MLFVVDRDVPGVSLDQMQKARRRAVEASARFTAQGRPVVYLRSMWMPSDGRALCVFEAASAELVEEVNRAARFPFLRVAEALDLAGEVKESNSSTPTMGTPTRPEATRPWTGSPASRGGTGSMSRLLQTSTWTVWDAAVGAGCQDSGLRMGAT